MSYSTIHHRSARLPKTQYSTTNRVQEIQDRAANEDEYLRVTEARMEREKQLRLETARRRRAQQLQQKKRARKEEDQRERKLKERLKKKSEYVNYVRKHLTKVTLRPKVRRSRRNSSTSTASKNSNGTHNNKSTRSEERSRTKVPQRQHIVTSELSQRGVTAKTSLVKFERIPVTESNDTNSPTEAGRLLKNLRSQMKRNEKLRCSIEALDLQVQIHHDHQLAKHEKCMQVSEVPENVVGNVSEQYVDDEEEENVVVEKMQEELLVVNEKKVVEKKIEYECDSIEGEERTSSTVSNCCNNNKENVTTSPLCSPKKMRKPLPVAPPISPENHFRIGKSPTWAKNLDPAPTKMFDSLDLSMSLRQSIEIERNRKRSDILDDINNDENIDHDPRAWTPKRNHKEKEQQLKEEQQQQQQSVGAPTRTTAAVETATKLMVLPISPPSIRRISAATCENPAPKANALTPDSCLNGPILHAQNLPATNTTTTMHNSPSSNSSSSSLVPSSPSSTAPYFEKPSNCGYLAMRRKAVERKKQMDYQRKKRKKQVKGSGLLEEDSRLRLQQRSSWGRDLSNLTPRRRARREAAMRRKEYEKMINLQMKEDRLQRRRLLQKKREKRLEEESRMLQDIHFQQQQMQQQQQQVQQQEVQIRPYHSQYQSSPQQQYQNSPLRPLGRDYNRRLAGIDPRSTISLEEDRLRGSLMRLEHKLNQTKRKYSAGMSTNIQKNVTRGVKGSMMLKNNNRNRNGMNRGRTTNGANENSMTILPPARMMPGINNSRYNNNNMNQQNFINQPLPNESNTGHQQQFIMEEQHSHGILRYPVAQKTTNSNNSANLQNIFSKTTATQSEAAGRYNTYQNQQQQVQISNARYHVQPPTKVDVVPGDNNIPAEVMLSYAVRPRVTTAPSGTTMGNLNYTTITNNGYMGLQSTRQETHLQRVANMGRTQQLQQETRAQSALPSVRRKTTTMRVITSTRKTPKGSLHQKPRTRRIKLGKSKVRTGGMNGHINVNRNKLHLLLSADE
jgi:hypothetical protein